MISSTLRKYHQPTPDMKSLSSDCYNFLMNFTDCAASPKIQDNPLYQRYVIPVIKEIETGYQQDITASAAEPERFCLSAVSFPSVPPFYGLLGLRVRYHVPHKPRPGASAFQTGYEDPGCCRRFRIFRCQPLYRHVP